MNARDILVLALLLTACASPWDDQHAAVGNPLGPPPAHLVPPPAPEPVHVCPPGGRATHPFVPSLPFKPEELP